MTTFVLVHGAWGGGWEWREVERLLRARGHEASRPTLTGLGERRHLSTDAVTLDTHVEDVVSHLAHDDLRDVVLCGHSYGGMVVTGVAARAPERIAQLVYVDAFVPEDGESLLDLLPGDLAASLRASASAGAIPVPYPFAETEARYGRWYAERSCPQPEATLTEPLRLRRGAPTIPRAYVRCTASDAPVAASAERARAAGWELRELATHHDPQVDDPAALCELLTGLAARQEATKSADATVSRSGYASGGSDEPAQRSELSR